MVIKEEEFVNSLDMINSAKRRRLIFNNIALEAYRHSLEKEMNIIQSNGLKSHYSLLNKFKFDEDTVKLYRTYDGALGLTYDEYNELEKIGLNEYGKRYRVIYSLENRLHSIVEELYNIKSEQNDLSYELLTDLFKDNSITLQDLGINKISSKLKLIFDAAHSSNNFKVWGNTFSVSDDFEERAILLVFQLIVRRAYYLNIYSNAKMFKVLKQLNPSLVVLSVGLSNTVFTTETLEGVEDIEIVTKNGYVYKIPPIILDSYDSNKRLYFKGAF